MRLLGFIFVVIFLQCAIPCHGDYVEFRAYLTYNQKLSWNGTLTMAPQACNGAIFGMSSGVTTPENVESCTAFNSPNTYVDYSITLKCTTPQLTMDISTNYLCLDKFSPTFTKVPGYYSNGTYFFSFYDQNGIFGAPYGITVYIDNVSSNYCTCTDCN